MAVSVGVNEHGNTIHYYTASYWPAMSDLFWTAEDCNVTVKRCGYPTLQKSNFDLTMTSRKGMHGDARLFNYLLKSFNVVDLPKIVFSSIRVALFENNPSNPTNFNTAMTRMRDEHLADVVVLVNVVEDLKPMMNFFMTLGYTKTTKVNDLDGIVGAQILWNDNLVALHTTSPSLPQFHFSVQKKKYADWVLMVLGHYGALLAAKPALPIATRLQFGNLTAGPGTSQAEVGLIVGGVGTKKCVEKQGLADVQHIQI